MRHVRIDDVIVARSDAAAAEPLPEGLPRKAYTEVIIVREDMVLIDGLRRLMWHRAQGHEVAPAVVVNHFLDAVDQLSYQHEGRTITPLRAWNVISTLAPYADAWRREKANGGWVDGPDGTRVKNERKDKNSYNYTGVRGQYQRAMNLTKHSLQPIMRMYRLAEAGDEAAQALVAQVDAGVISPFRAEELYRKPYNLRGSITGEAEQRRLLDRGVVALQAQVDALNKLGHPLKVRTDEIRKAVDGLTVARAQVSTLISGLKLILKEREINE